MVNFAQPLRSSDASCDRKKQTKIIVRSATAFSIVRSLDHRSGQTIDLAGSVKKCSRKEEQQWMDAGSMRRHIFGTKNIERASEGVRVQSG